LHDVVLPGFFRRHPFGFAGGNGRVIATRLLKATVFVRFGGGGSVGLGVGASAFARGGGLSLVWLAANLGVIFLEGFARSSVESQLT
jgi:hypothetical protein